MVEACRVCMDESDTHLDIFEEQSSTDFEPSLLEMLNECTAHEVNKNDQLPTKICSNCVSSCLTAFRFRRICEESRQLFMELLAEQKPSSQSTETELDLGCVKVENVDDEIVAENTWIAADQDETELDDIVKVEPTCISEANFKPAADNDDPELTDDPRMENTPISEDDDDSLILIETKGNASSNTNQDKSQIEQQKKRRTSTTLQINNKTYHYCHLCKMKYVNLDKLNQHLKAHQDMLQAFRCRYCEKKFAKRSYLNAHVRFHTGNSKPYTCPQCPRTFAGKKDLDEHTASFHKKNQEKRKRSDQSNPTERAKIKRRKLEERLERIRKEVAAIAAAKSAARAEKRIHRCGTCDQVFSDLSTLAEHLQKHQIDEHPGYTCPRCSKHFEEHSELKTHVCSHDDDRHSMCPICSKEFYLERQLKQHMLLHSDDTPFQCPHCPKAFKRSSNLQSHQRTHSIERPFACPHCSKTFNHPANLEMHLRIHPKAQK